jgi:octaprenyl-diphosphate synthase
MESLPPAERSALAEEVAGRLPPQPALRLGQMERFGVFPAVASAINDELAAAARALADWNGPASSALLRLAGVLQEQVAALNKI